MMLTPVAMQEADLYLTEVDICRYWPTDVDLSSEDSVDCWAAGKGSFFRFTPAQLLGPTEETSAR